MAFIIKGRTFTDTQAGRLHRALTEKKEQQSEEGIGESSGHSTLALRAEEGLIYAQAEAELSATFR
jgi:hypothetical protein